ncbi:LuxR family transcriptional regulator [Nostocaceae cyanobacterium CENA369]|uniref:LuxR family transcriptional regulator n=1 Tax=Dendronalium phyllosphericum CENA369 TaxID=1725256 RepID=A0A8J7I2J7_9NOST|nr:LuxR C-terminal-related transcriptional regulator [Dendronalium phyllosphericum]MBH8572483.1 LuxR family transcriptional regulator [Dendronalium phyllosphericum CENA369]
MTVNSLQFLFQAIAQARNEEELRQHVIIDVGKYFVAKRWGLFLFERLSPIEGNLPSIVKLALSTEYNPVLRYVVERHAPVHEELVLPPGVWKMICPRSDHGHVMAGPIVSNGRLIGGVGFTRHSDTPAFNAGNLADLSALCLHLSTWMATRQLQSKQFNSANINCLTPREIQIAELVAQGLTNAEIGAALWIQENSVKQALKRMFRKLGVSCRAEMIAQLYSKGG